MSIEVKKTVYKKAYSNHLEFNPMIRENIEHCDDGSESENRYKTHATTYCTRDKNTNNTRNNTEKTTFFLSDSTNSEV